MAKEEPVFRFFFHYLLLSVNDAQKDLDLFSPIPTLLFGCVVGFCMCLLIDKFSSECWLTNRLVIEGL